jgi:hypothetical protein
MVNLSINYEVDILKGMWNNNTKGPKN